MVAVLIALAVATIGNFDFFSKSRISDLDEDAVVSLTAEQRLRMGIAVDYIVELDISTQDANGNRRSAHDIAIEKAEIITGLSESIDSERLRSLPFTNALVATVQSLNELRRLQTNPKVTGVFEDRVNALLLQDSLEVIHAIPPWNDDGSNYALTGAGYAVAVIDNGVWGTAGLNIQAEACFSTPNISQYEHSLCASGVSTPTVMYTDPGSATTCSGQGSCDHGTHVAGIVSGNTIRPGVAPGAPIVAIQTFIGKGASVFARDSDIKSSLGYVYFYNLGIDSGDTAGNQIIAVNMSLGRDDAGDCTTGGSGANSLATELENLAADGVSVIASSGNDSHVDRIKFPACIDFSVTSGPDVDVISVGATNKWDVTAPFSQAAQDPTDYTLDMLAPGAGIESVYGPLANNLSHLSGTSMAAPHVAGCVALLAEQAAAAGAMPSQPTRAATFASILKSTGVPVEDHRDALIETPRLDCGAAIHEMRGDAWQATITGRKMEDTDGDVVGDAPLAGWTISAYDISAGATPQYAGHPAYSAITDANGYYSIQVGWGEWQLAESSYGPVAGSPIPTTNQYWEQVSPTLGAILVEPNGATAFTGNDFVNRRADYCPSGQTYTAFVSGIPDHYTTSYDGSAPHDEMYLFYQDRYKDKYSPLPFPANREFDQDSLSTKPFIQKFDLTAIPSAFRFTKAGLDVGGRPVRQPPSRPNGAYINIPERLERNDAMWLMFADANGEILGNPTTWGRGIGNNSIIGDGLLAADWDYPAFETRYDFNVTTPSLPIASVPSLADPDYLDRDLRPMMDLHRHAGLLFQDDTNIDYTVLHTCTVEPGFAIDLAPKTQQLDLNVPYNFSVSLQNLTGRGLSAPDKLIVTGELSPGTQFDPDIAATYSNWGGDWSCETTINEMGGDSFVCTYNGPNFSGTAPQGFDVPVVTTVAGTHQTCMSMDVIDTSGAVLDHNSVCVANAIGYDVGARKRKNKNWVRWDDPSTSGNDDPLIFSLQPRNYGKSITVPPVGVTVTDDVLHEGYVPVTNAVTSGPNWQCTQSSNTTSPFNSLLCDLINMTVDPGFNPSPLSESHGFKLPVIEWEFRGHQIGWFKNCHRVAMSTVVDGNPANDIWCVWAFVQGNIHLKKDVKTLGGDNEVDFGGGISELFDFLIDIENWAGEIDPARVEIVMQDLLPTGIVVSNPSLLSTQNPDWDCSLTVSCTYTPIASEGSSVTPTPLDTIKIPVVANEPGFYENCAGAMPEPTLFPDGDTEPDDLTPPDPGIAPDTDFQLTDKHNEDCIEIIVGHDVQLQKSAIVNGAENPYSVIVEASQTLQFVIRVTNHLSSIDPGDVLIVQDTLPPGFAIGTLPNGGPGDWNCSIVGGSLSAGYQIECVFDNSNSSISYPAGILGSAIIIDVKAPEQIGNYTNCAKVDVQLDNNDEDDIPGNEEDCVDIIVPGHLSVKKNTSTGQTEYDVGDTIEFHIEVINEGGVIAAPVTINLADTITLSGLTHLATSWPPGWPCSTNSLSCAVDPAIIGEINPNDSFFIRIAMEGTNPGKYTNCFNVSLNNATNVPGAQHDPCVTFYVGHDLSIDKMVDNPNPVVGTQVTFTLSVDNNLGSIQAYPTETVTVTDLLPGNLVFSSTTDLNAPPDWTCSVTPSGGFYVINCIWEGTGPIPPESSLPDITITATVIDDTPLTNCAEVTLDGASDDIPGNNGYNQTECVTITPVRATLDVTKTVLYCDVDGTSCVFRVTVTNAGGVPYIGDLFIYDIMDVDFAGHTLLPSPTFNNSTATGQTCNFLQNSLAIGIPILPIFNSNDLGYCQFDGATIQPGGSISYDVEVDPSTLVLPDGSAATNCVLVDDGADQLSDWPTSCVDLELPTLNIEKQLVNCAPDMSTCTFSITISNPTTVDYYDPLIIGDLMDVNFTSLTLSSTIPVPNFGVDSGVDNSTCGDLIDWLNLPLNPPFAPFPNHSNDLSICGFYDAYIMDGDFLTFDVTVTFADPIKELANGGENCAFIVTGPYPNYPTECADIPPAPQPVLDIEKEVTYCTANLTVCAFEIKITNLGPGSYNGDVWMVDFMDTSFDDLTVIQGPSYTNANASGLNCVTLTNVLPWNSLPVTGMPNQNSDDLGYCSLPGANIAQGGSVSFIVQEVFGADTAPGINCAVLATDDDLEDMPTSCATYDWPALDISKTLDSCTPKMSECTFTISIANGSNTPYYDNLYIFDLMSTDFANFTATNVVSPPVFGSQSGADAQQCQYNANSVQPAFSPPLPGLPINADDYGTCAYVAAYIRTGDPLAFDITVTFPPGVNPSGETNCVYIYDTTSMNYVDWAHSCDTIPSTPLPQDPRIEKTQWGCSPTQVGCNFKISVTNIATTNHTAPITVFDWIPGYTPNWAMFSNLTVTSAPPGWSCSILPASDHHIECTNLSPNIPPNGTDVIEITVDIVGTGAPIQNCAGMRNLDSSTGSCVNIAHGKGEWRFVKTQVTNSCITSDPNFVLLCRFEITVINDTLSPFSGAVEIVDELQNSSGVNTGFPLNAFGGTTPGWACAQNTSTNAYECAHPGIVLNPGESETLWIEIHALGTLGDANCARMTDPAAIVPEECIDVR